MLVKNIHSLCIPDIGSIWFEVLKFDEFKIIQKIIFGGKRECMTFKESLLIKDTKMH